MRYYKRLKVYKSNNNYFDPNKIEAYSYNWWKFVSIIKGKIVFNTYRYSNTTSRHQYNVRSVMRDLGIKIDCKIDCPKGLDHLYSGIVYYQYEISKLKELINNPKSRKFTNIDRLKRIKELELKIKEVKGLMSVEELINV
jgi:hypothetical protein